MATIEPQDYDLEWLTPGATVYRIGYTRYSTGAVRITRLTVDRLTKTLAIFKDKDGKESRVNRTFKGQQRPYSYDRKPTPVYLVEYSAGSYSSSHVKIVPPEHPLIAEARMQINGRDIKNRAQKAIVRMAYNDGWTVEHLTELRDAAQAMLDAAAEQGA